jgi:hypothetical protein
MKKIKESDIYPKYEFRLNHKQKKWLQQELAKLKRKFSDTKELPVSKQAILIAALRHGFRYLEKQKKICP